MSNQGHIRRVNTKIAAGFEMIEEKLKRAGNLVELFETLVEEVESQFQVPFVWLTLVNNEKSAPVIEALQSSELLKERVSLISPVFFREIFPSDLKPVLSNSNLKKYFRLFPADRKYFVRSIALVPFKISEEIWGIWNNGDASPDRYLPDMETTFLQRFAQSFSESLAQLFQSGKIK
jgi:uncharacterized protein YigA (DUF484 family)